MENSQLLTLLKETRISRNIKQGEVAAYLNIDVSAVSLYETGKRNITVELLEKWLGFFNLKYIVVNKNAKETMLNPVDEDVVAFQKLKDRRNKIIRNCHIEQSSQLQKLFTNKVVIANQNMELVSMVEELSLQTGYATIIYYKNFVINATFEGFVDCANLVPHDRIPLGRIVEFHKFIERIHLPSFELSNKNWSSNGVVMYIDNDKEVFIRDAKGFTPELLMKVKENLIQYKDQVNDAKRIIEENSHDFEELEMLQNEISKTAQKWSLSANLEHPMFENWSSSDYHATCYVENLTEETQ